jgi:AcrR family transcriptional regulator
MPPRTRFRGPGRPPANEARDRVGDIVAAARVRFADDGFGGAALSTIAADAGLSLSALYHYFPDKNALFERVYLDTLELGWDPWIRELEELDPAMDLAAKLRTTHNPATDPDEVQAAFFTPAQVHARRVPELRHLLDHRDTYRRRSFELLVGSLADEGRIRNADTTEEAIDMLEILHSGWIFESAFHPERVQQHFASFLAVAEGLTVDD